MTQKRLDCLKRRRRDRYKILTNGRTGHHLAWSEVMAFNCCHKTVRKMLLIGIVICIMKAITQGVSQATVLRP